MDSDMGQTDTSTTDQKPRHAFRTGLRVLRLTWQERPVAVSVYAMGAFLEIGSSLLSMYATAKLGSLLAAYLTTREVGDIWFWLWIDIACAVGIAFGFWMMSASKRLVYFKMVRWATTGFQEAVSRLDLADYDNSLVRNQINKVSAGYTWQVPNLAESVMDFCYSLIRFAAITAVAAQIGWWVVLVLAVFLLPSLLAENRLQKLQWFVWDYKGDNRHIFWGLEWMLRQHRNIMELRSMQAREYLLRKVEHMNEDFYSIQEKAFRQVSRVIVPSKLFEVGGTAIGAVVLLRQFLAGSIGLDRYFFLSGALLRVGGALNAVFGSISRMQEQLLFAEDFFELLERKQIIVDRPGSKQLSGTIVPNIEFRNVSFTYPGKKREVFHKLSFVIAPGEHVALVGENGAGKTTLIKLLLRFYVPTGGQILIDGVDLQAISIESWYARVATLFQSFNEYPFPIHENVSIGDPTVGLDRSRLQSAGDKSDVTEMVNHLPYGWDTVLNSSFEKGIEPSGGQWQRLALARAFYRDAPVLILDEPTSAIDAKAEYDIFNNIFEHYQNRTAIIISHRFSTVRRAHRIIVLDKGKIAEQGTHTTLMQSKGLYHELFTKQAEGYK
ncbi:ABC transporter ATP-binding protein [Candidatus Saccharibacteria bacterium]|nr:MAG: ABC transporter ATP-binding protein [Candidatus Saccharibacteria bacterium]